MTRLCLTICSSTQRKLDQTFREEVAERCGATTKTARQLIGIIFGCIICDLRTAKRKSQELRSSIRGGEKNEGSAEGDTEAQADAGARVDETPDEIAAEPVGSLNGRPQRKTSKNRLSGFGVYTGGLARSSRVAPSFEEKAGQCRPETAGTVSSVSEVSEIPSPSPADYEALSPADYEEGDMASSTYSCEPGSSTQAAPGSVATRPTNATKLPVPRRYRVAMASTDETDGEPVTSAPVASGMQQETPPLPSMPGADQAHATSEEADVHTSDADQLDAAARENLQDLLCCPITQQVGDSNCAPSTTR